MSSEIQEITDDPNVANMQFLLVSWYLQIDTLQSRNCSTVRRNMFYIDQFNLSRWLLATLGNLGGLPWGFQKVWKTSRLTKFDIIQSTFFFRLWNPNFSGQSTNISCGTPPDKQWSSTSWPTSPVSAWQRATRSRLGGSGSGNCVTKTEYPPWNQQFVPWKDSRNQKESRLEKKQFSGASC